MSFVVFVFVGVLWSQTSGMDAPTVQFEITRAACEQDRAQWLADHQAANDAEAPASRTGFGATPCMMTISQAGEKSA